MLAPDQLKEYLARLEPDQPAHFVIHDTNWLAWEIFADCSTQWRLKPEGGIQSLDYSAVAAVIQIHQTRWTDPRKLLHQVRLIERGALAGFANTPEEEILGA